MSQVIANVLALFITNLQKQTISSKKIVLEEQGIVGDKHYGKEPSRTVLITSTYAYDLLLHENINAHFGALGENIVIDYDLHQLNPGDKIALGEVVLKIAQNCTLCNHLSKIDKRVPKLLRNDRGIFAQVVKGGELHLDDEVRLVGA